MAKKNPIVPNNISAGGKVYHLVVMQIHTRDAQGRPKDVSLLYDEGTVNIKGGEEFLTGFIPAEMAKKGN